MKIWMTGMLVAGLLLAQSPAELVARANRLSGEEAVKLLRQAIAQDDSYAAAHYVLGRKLLELKRWPEAETHFARALSRIASSDPAVVRRAKALALAGSGVALFEQNKLAAAERRLKDSLAENRTQEAEDLLTRIRATAGGSLVSAQEITRTLVAEDPDLGAPAGSIDLVINFDYDKDTLKPEGQAQAVQLADALKSLDGKRFRIVGHTDRHGTEAYNNDLSLRRAARVRAFLVTRGVAAARLEAHGMGKQSLLSMQETPAADAVNRRVEVQVVE